MSLRLKHVSVQAPFQQWGLDFLGKIHLTYSVKHIWILMGTYYFTKWIEALPIRKATDLMVIQFLENIPSRFGYPKRIITNNA